MKCAEYSTDLSALADDALDAERAVRLRHHLDECRSCDGRFRQLARLRRIMRSAGRLTPPEELALAIRVRLSQEAHRSFYDRLVVRLKNFMEPIAVPAVAGLLSAIVLFGILIHSFAIRTPVLTDDMALEFNTPPRLQHIGDFNFNTGEQGLLLELHVDEQGRIVDFRLLNGPHDPNTMAQLRGVLLFSKFEPAMRMGFRRQATAVFNFARVNVKG